MLHKLTIALLAAAAVLAMADAAGASQRQIQIIQADPPMLSDPVGTLAQFRALGANTVRIIVHWDFIAPDIKPVDGADPNSYPAANWAPYDAIVRDAQKAGMRVDFTVAGGAPRWAEGAHIPPQGLADKSFAWKPDAKLYGDFVHAVGERYSGSFTPPSASVPLPRVRFWAIWNEPNFGQDLGPQAINGSTVSVAPMMYRNLVDSGWRALNETGHGSDTIVIGGLAAEGRSGPVNAKHPQGLPGDYAQTKPLQYIPTLYCLSAAYKPLRGSYARARGCPTNAAGTRAFRAQHPGLFNAGGVADHPYSGGRSPVDAKGLDRNFAVFSQLGDLEQVLDRSVGAYGSRKRYPIYSDEYGYITRPPQVAPYASPATAAYYMNWSEYLSWRSPRIGSYAQYLLRDPPPGTQIGFTSGLETDLGKRKATYGAYRMPLYLPVTSVRTGRPTEVWGSARPAPFMARDGQGPQTVAIQLQTGGHGAFKTIRTLNATGYFDVHQAFTRSGNVRLAYTYPATDPFLPVGFAGTTAYSRIVKLQVS
ncbi:MAG TPA: hypothetical protein VHW04_02055 [Solirubrobacteraceae bacterium]|nr:hypothetical protein [Solirubrobacteraceae bacterium]